MLIFHAFAAWSATCDEVIIVLILRGPVCWGSKKKSKKIFVVQPQALGNYIIQVIETHLTAQTSRSRSTSTANENGSLHNHALLWETEQCTLRIYFHWNDLDSKSTDSKHKFSLFKSLRWIADIYCIWNWNLIELNLNWNLGTESSWNILKRCLHKLV